AGLVAGALSMAAGEYVSVSSQSDAERADLELEQWELEHQREFELEELAGIYQKRGLSGELAREVATQLMAKDALGAHARDELGISDALTAKPLVAALASALTFAAGALLPLVTLLVSPAAWVVPLVAGTTLICLAGLGAAAALAGGAPPGPGALRVAFWGGVAMALTAGAGKLFGVVS
ncbi:MAG TPA: VIT1/CCC1 transporter family protein, partial [Polyangiales bacterium]